MDKKAGKAWSHPHYLHEEKADAGAGIEHAGWQNRSNQPVVLELLQAPPLHLPLIASNFCPCSTVLRTVHPPPTQPHRLQSRYFTQQQNTRQSKE